MPVTPTLHEEHGVRWDRGEPPLPRNYGDTAAEYHAARHAAAVADRPDRRFLRVHGRDPVRMVQGLVSNDVAGAPPERAVYATVLTPKGKMVADVRVVRRDGELLLETDAAAADSLAEHLRKFVPPLFARFEDAGGSWAALGLYGPTAGRLLAGLVSAGTVPDAAAEDVVSDVAFDDVPVVLVTTSQLDVPGYDLLCPADAVDAVWRRLTGAGAVPLGHATLDVLRIEAGRPRWGAELGDAVIPLEAGLRARAISETKGCYTGQEVIVRILHRGHVNRQLRGVLLGELPAPARDTPLVRESDGRQVGQVTSAAWSPKHGQAIALAYVRREVEPPAAVRLGAPDGPEVLVVALPFEALE
jgi:folate-binding protein YgfZ